ncbi:hypothetical protein CTI12_AA443750 [Artemisia annua]|uniref:Uncharacterized protein n=1 Tax=Artemisia annua TaxID=35608 RepID=A0A2U1KWQ7_ARTAN|nr:hypothetical protein CTI12_AA443750 [Artemisia annua]
METNSFSIAAMLDFSTQAVVPIQGQQPMADETSFIQSLIGSQENQTKRKRKHVSDTSRCSSLHETQYPVSRNSIHYAPDGSKCKVPTTLGKPSQEVPHAVQQMHDFAQKPSLLSNEGKDLSEHGICCKDGGRWKEESYAAKMEAVGKRSLHQAMCSYFWPP